MNSVRSNERVAFHNGEIKPESSVLVSFRDRGFKYGEAVFDTCLLYTSDAADE